VRVGGTHFETNSEILSLELAVVGFQVNGKGGRQTADFLLEGAVGVAQVDPVEVLQALAGLVSAAVIGDQGEDFLAEKTTFALDAKLMIEQLSDGSTQVLSKNDGITIVSGTFVCR
jgi:hypothetical protein